MSTHLTNVLNVQHAIEQLTIKQSLSYSQSKALFNEIMQGTFTLPKRINPASILNKSKAPNPAGIKPSFFPSSITTSHTFGASDGWHHIS